MDVAVFSAKAYDREFLDRANAASGHLHRLSYLEARLSPETALLARKAPVICAFVNDSADARVLEEGAAAGLRLIALRAAGFNNVDLTAARRLGVTVARVPAYAPQAVAEHTVGMILSLARQIHRAYVRVREGNFELGGLLGFGLSGCVVGIVGTGRIGAAVARIMLGFGCRVVAHDIRHDPDLAARGVAYVALSDLLAQADIVTLHCPLTPQTHHLIDAAAVQRMKPGAMLVNTSRGAIVDTRALISGLKSGAIGQLGLDVYEEEGDLFFQDLSNRVIRDDVFARLLTFPNVLVTAHQAFFTREALTAIAETTIANITAFEKTGRALHEISVEKLA